MKKFISALLSLVMILAMPATAFASAPDGTIRYLPTDVDEITEEIIEEYGIITIDEDGNKIISIPLFPANDVTDISNKNYDSDNNIQGLVHEGHHVPDNIVLPRHFSLTPHTHTVTDVSSFNLNTFVPATEFARAGFTVTKEYSRGVTVNAALDLSGGISKGDVEAALGVNVGGSYVCGESESYQSPVIPSGYKGRIVYRYTCTVYMFTNKTAYFWPNTIPQLITYEYDDCTAESGPRDGYFDLQLIAM